MLQSPKRVYVGVDLHPREQSLRGGSANAAEQALWVARHARAELVLFHSTFLDETAELPPGGLPTEEGQLTAEGWTALESLRQHCEHAGVSTRIQLSPERAWIVLARAALAGEADLIVAAKRDTADVDPRRLGNVATKLMRKCPGPVWLVKPDHDLAHKLVLAASDLSSVGRDVVEWGSWVALASGSSLHVVHAYQLPREAMAAGAEEQQKRLESLRRRAQRSLKTQLKAYSFAREPVLHLGRNTPFHAILEAVEHLHPDLLVMATLSQGGVRGMLVGSTAERILARVDCSLLLLKPEGYVSPIQA